MSETRAERAYTDVLAVEWDDETGLARIITLSDCYLAVPKDGQHLCPDREYRDIDMCKHLYALEATRGKIDIPEGWLVTDNLDERTEPELIVDGGKPPGNQPKGIDQWILWDVERENAHYFDRRGDAEEKLDNAEEMGVDVELYPPGEAPEELFGPTEAFDVASSQDTEADGGEPEQVKAEVVGEHPAPDTEPDPQITPFEGGFGIDRDPLEVLPGWMISEITYPGRGDSSFTVNKRGCQVIAEYLDIEVSTKALTAAEDTEFEYAYYQATATKPDGRTFTGHGTARADGDDQHTDERWKLDMMAETRAYKRAVKAATGGGLEAFAKERGEQ